MDDSSQPVVASTAPHASFDRLVEVMDRLYSPGGCPWDREQTHESLVQYLLEEAHELAEAIETDDRPGIREELGDLLLQVVFHARIASEDLVDPFTTDDVADDLVAKLIRRHPHVFADAVLATSGDDDPNEALHAQWDTIKKAEKQRTSVLEGIPVAQGSLARAQKVLSRATRAGLGEVVAAGEAPMSGTPGEPTAPAADAPTAEAALGRELMDLVRRAQAEGVDAESALRRELRRIEASIQAAEA